MDVQETRLREVLQGQTQYRVPLYQRPYSWTIKQLERLWADILELAETHETSPATTHFTGSLVLSTGQIGPNGTEFLVVDGQQRLTTLSILVAALRDHYAETEPENPAQVARLEETFLVDRFKQGDDRLKLLPTQADRPAYRSIIAGAIDHSTPSGLIDAYRFFRTKLRLADDPDDPHDIPRLEGAVLNGLVFVAITAKGEDNVYRIFESLNNTGMKLTQGDLLRNYLFMRAGERGEEVYDTWWLPMQKILSPSDLEALFWIDLIWRNPDAKAGDIYSGQVDRLRHLDQVGIIDEVKRFKRLAELFAIYRDPDQESDPEVAKRLRRVKSWGIGSMDVLVLFWLRLRDDRRIGSAEVSDALHLIESFLVRRIVVGAPANSLPRIFNRASTELGDAPSVEALRRYFTVGRKFFATDAQIADAVLKKPFYYQGRPHQRKTVLAWLEEATPITWLGVERQAREHADISATSIEHVMPQSLSPIWRDAIAVQLDDEGGSVDEAHEEFLHTLANLTLTAYNSELSNRPFTEKRQLLEASGLRMNHEIASRTDWGPLEIRARGRVLSERIVSMWAGPLADTDADDSGVRWKLAIDAVAAIPAGRWASYGDVAAVAGTHPVPLGQFLATKQVPGAHRVLQITGTVSPGFTWGPDSPNEGVDVHELLSQEGLEFDADGHASADQRLRVSELAESIGLSVRSDEEPLTEEDGGDRNAFLAQLAAEQAPSTLHGVIELLNAWERLGGRVEFGTGNEISCILVLERPERGKTISPFVIYPYGSIEVAFQYLVNRAPFDEPELRDALRSRLNAITGIDLAADRLESRPSFPVDVIASRTARDQVVEVLEWFVNEVATYDSEFAA
ncbi:DUF262 domain-containing protein [Agromyces sp. MMS24-JH15]|uniref:GmrSD restriction endonuclease domain-containing protein n=1 Tax=Agromyces sp. MMS24-JH15 TaxID=3243765 RepID=UPI00374A3EF0